MLKIFKRLLAFSGQESKRLVLSFVFHMCHSFFEMLPIMAILTVLSAILGAAAGRSMSNRVIGSSLAIMLLSIIGKIFFINLSAVKRTLAALPCAATGE